MNRRSALRALRARPARNDAPIERARAGSTLSVIGALAVLNVIRHLVPRAGTWVSATAALVLVVHARREGMTWSQLGLGRDRLRSGGAWALGTVAAVSAVYLLGVLVPATRRAFLDERYEASLGQALTTALVGIPMGTVLVEEVAFRSVLPELLARHAGPRGAHAISSALFGLWHVLPSLDFASARASASRTPTSAPSSSSAPRRTTGSRRGSGTDGPAATLPTVAGTVVFTALAGAAFSHLRRRSDSVLASAGLHWATNGLGVLFGVLARRLAAAQQRPATA